MNEPQTDKTMTQLSDTVKSDIELGKEAVTLLQKKDYFGLAALAEKNFSTVKSQVVAIENAIPAIKAGWKTSEFWLITVFIVANVIFAYKGMPLPLGDDISIGSLVAAYTASRHALKNQ